MTERDVILRERAAFVEGAAWRFGKALKDAPERKFRPVLTESIEDAAAKLYPMMVTRARVVLDPQNTTYGLASGHVGKLYWSVKDGQLHAVDRTGQVVPEWEDDQRRDSWPTPNRVAIWADLLANPTETVDA